VPHFDWIHAVKQDGFVSLSPATENKARLSPRRISLDEPLSADPGGRPPHPRTAATNPVYAFDILALDGDDLGSFRSTCEKPIQPTCWHVVLTDPFRFRNRVFSLALTFRGHEKQETTQ